MLEAELDCKPAFGGIVGAGKIGMPGSTLGISQALPPGYTMIGIIVVLLVPKLMTLDVVNIEVKLANAL